MRLLALTLIVWAGACAGAAWAQTATAAVPAAATSSKIPASTDPHAVAGTWKAVRLPGETIDFTLLGTQNLLKTTSLMDQYAAVAKRGMDLGTAWNTCRPGGITVTMFNIDGIEVLQTADQVILLFKEPRMIRYIWLKHAPPPPPKGSYRGYSLGHWDGNTLVVETSGANGLFQLDHSGLPASTALHTQERYTKSADGTSLNVDITITDPEYYSAPTHVHRQWAWEDSGEPQGEYDCSESPPQQKDSANTYYLMDSYRPACERVETTTTAPSRVVCSSPP
jgi:hypothetical protein